MSIKRKRRCTVKTTVVVAGGKTESSEFTGWFHEWGVDSYEVQNGVVTHSVAIVEDNEGQTHLVHPTLVEFY